MRTKLIGSKIAEARKKMNMSQAQLAKRLFISAQAVGKWERGESMPDILTLTRLSEFLGVDLNYFSGNILPAADEAVGEKLTVNMDELEQKTAESYDRPRSAERQVQINLNAVNLQDSDFAGVILHEGKFKVTPLSRANFAGADLTDSSFEISDAREANFDGANLTDCKFSVFDLAGASFHRSILVSTHFSKLGLEGARFTDVRLTDVTLSMADLRKTIFENCIFDGVDIMFSDLRGLCLDGQTFIGVRFEESALNDVSFRGATFRNVTFQLPFSLTNKSYRAMKTICFDGARMDKLTYAALKGIRVVDLSKVTII